MIFLFQQTALCQCCPNPSAQFGALIRTENLEAGLDHKREAREVHDPTTVSGLLSVPRYADALEADDDEDGSRPSKLVKSAAAWRAEVDKWVKAAQEDEDEGIPAEVPAPPASRSRSGKFFPRSLELLFGGEVAKPVTKPRREQFTEEVLMMQLLAAEESDEEPDDSELSVPAMILRCSSLWYLSKHQFRKNPNLPLIKP